MILKQQVQCNRCPLQHAGGAVPEGEPGDRGGAGAGGEGHVGEQRPLLHLLPHHQPHQQVQHQLQGQSVSCSVGGISQGVHVLADPVWVELDLERSWIFQKYEEITMARKAIEEDLMYVMNS